jgi:enamine deaminase RidA (YjgF/YER057c/UK114 family)
MADNTPVVAPRAIWPAGVTPDMVLGSPAVKAGDWLFVAGQFGGDHAQGLAPAAMPVNPHAKDGLQAQAAEIYRRLEPTITAGGCDISRDVVRIWQWFASDYPTRAERHEGITWPRVFIQPYLNVRDGYVKAPKPASTAVTCHSLLDPRAKVQTDMICIDGQGESRAFSTPKDIPSPVTHYSPAHQRGDWVFLAGEMAVDWQGDFYAEKFPGHASGLSKEARINPYFWFGSVIEAQTEYVLMKLSKTAKAAGASLERAVKADVYLADPADYAGMDAVWKKWFPNNPPARCVMPNIGFGGYGGRIEIAFTLLADDSDLVIETIHTDDAPTPFGHEPQAVKVGRMVFLSGQQACGADGGAIAGSSSSAALPWSQPAARNQVATISANVEAICRAAGARLDTVSRSCWFMNDGALFAEANAAWMDRFGEVKPATTVTLVDGEMVVPGTNLLMDLIAYAVD